MRLEDFYADFNKEAMIGTLARTGLGAVVGAGAGYVQGHTSEMSRQPIKNGRRTKKQIKSIRRRAIRRAAIGGVMGAGAGLTYSGLKKIKINKAKSRQKFKDEFEEASRKRSESHRQWKENFDRENRQWEENFRRQKSQWENRYSRSGGGRSNSNSGGSRKNYGGSSYSSAPRHEEAAKFFNVSNATTKKEVKKAYRAAAKKHHPDAGGTDAGMKEVNDYYDTLKASDWMSKLSYYRGLVKEAKRSERKMRDNREILLASMIPIAGVPLSGFLAKKGQGWDTAGNVSSGQSLGALTTIKTILNAKNMTSTSGLASAAGFLSLGGLFGGLSSLEME